MENCVEEKLGPFTAQVERPEPLKFAWPIILFPDLFSPPKHLSLLLGYLATMGWEAYTPDFETARAAGSTPIERFSFSDLTGLAREALEGLGRDAILVGHGVGGLLALTLAGVATVRAAVAYAPLIPGFKSPLTTSLAARLAIRRGRPLRPPKGRILYELVADADSFHRDSIIKTMIPASARLAQQIASGEIGPGCPTPAKPMLVLAGDCDKFAPREQTLEFAQTIGARLRFVQGRGHWLIAGRALERLIAETQRFLVQSLGQDLLLLFPEAWKRED